MSVWSASDILSAEERDVVFRWLSVESRWARGMPRDVFDRAMANSLIAGVRDRSGKLKGFARVVTDRATFAYLDDVFVCPTSRGEGAGSSLVAFLMEHPDLQNLRRWMLVTRDAHGLYARHGFGALPDPGRVMVRNSPDPYGRQVSVSA